MPLGHVPEAGIVSEGGARHTEDVDFPGEQIGEAEKSSGDRRLARPVGAEHEDHLTGADAEVNIGDDRPLAIPSSTDSKASRYSQPCSCANARLVQL